MLLCNDVALKHEYYQVFYGLHATADCILLKAIVVCCGMVTNR
jgi:hypothetical protein